MSLNGLIEELGKKLEVIGVEIIDDKNNKEKIVKISW